MSTRALTIALASSLVVGTFGTFAACGSGSSSRDICARVTMAHVNDICGAAATATMSFDEPGTDYDSRACFYDDGAAGPPVSALRFTFHGGAEAARARFDEDRGALVGTITDLVEPGDAAFYLEDLPTNSASIHVLQAETYVTINDNVVSAQNASLVMQCLPTLAIEVLAVR